MEYINIILLTGILIALLYLIVLVNSIYKLFSKEIKITVASKGTIVSSKTEVIKKIN